MYGALLVSALFCARQPALAAPGLCPPDRIDATAEVAYAHDGDTVRLKDGRRIRLIGIDTPELARDQRPAEALAVRARDALRQALRSSDGRVSLRYGAQRHDKYGRTLGHLFLPDGENLQARLIALGLAKAFTTPPNDRYSDCYRRVEKTARDKRLGLWDLPRYQLMAPEQLKSRANGFHRIKGRVTRVYQGDRGISLYLGPRMTLRIYGKDLHYFSLPQLQQMKGKTLHVRGWLHASRNGFFMVVRHPDAFESLK